MRLVSARWLAEDTRLLPEPSVEDFRQEPEGGSEKRDARIPLAVSACPRLEGIEARGGSVSLLLRYKLVEGVGKGCDLQDSRIAELRTPGSFVKSEGAKGKRNVSRRPDGRNLSARRKPVDDGARMGGGVPDGVRASKKVVLAPHGRIAPSVCAEEVEVGERPERRQLQEHPCGHLVYRVARDEGPEVGVVLQTGDLALAPVAVGVVEVREVVGEDGVSVLVGVFGYPLDELRLGGAFHVERERQQEPAQLLVYPGEVHQVPEVEPGVLAVVLAAYPLGKEHAVRREAEVVVLLGEDARGFLLVAQLEGHALGFQVLYLLLDGELGLSLVLFLGFVHGTCLSCSDGDRPRGAECAMPLDYPPFRIQLRTKRRSEGAPRLHEPEHRLEQPAHE